MDSVDLTGVDLPGCCFEAARGLELLDKEGVDLGVGFVFTRILCLCEDRGQ